MTRLDWLVAVVAGSAIAAAIIGLVELASAPQIVAEPRQQYQIAIRVVEGGREVCLSTEHDDARRGLAWAERIVARLNDDAGRPIAAAYPGQRCRRRAP